jgi:hypothetical protein
MPGPLARVFKRSENFVFRVVEGEAILVPIRAQAADLDGLYGLNTVGARIWEAIDGRCDLRAVRDRLVAEYAVSADQAETDLLAFVAELCAIEALLPAAAGDGNRTHG